MYPRPASNKYDEEQTRQTRRSQGHGGRPATLGEKDPTSDRDNCEPEAQSNHHDIDDVNYTIRPCRAQH